MNLVQVLEELDDSELHRLVTCRNERALEVLMSRYDKAVTGLISIKAWSWDDAQLFVSQAWVDYWNDPERWTSESAGVRGWIYTMADCRRITAWKQSDAYRRAKEGYKEANAIAIEGVSASHNGMFMQTEETVEAEVERNELLYMFAEFLHKLSKEKSVPLSLYIMQGMTEGEIARHLELAFNLCRSRLTQAKFALKEWFTLGRILGDRERLERQQLARLTRVPKDAENLDGRKTRGHLRSMARQYRYMAARNTANKEKRQENRKSWKLSPAQKEEIRAKYAKGDTSLEKLSLEYGFHPTTIYNAIHPRPKREEMAA